MSNTFTDPCRSNIGGPDPCDIGGLHPCGVDAYALSYIIPVFCQNEAQMHFIATLQQAA